MLASGALASFVTQPMEVLKTNMINRPDSSMREIHQIIVKAGYDQYMRGSLLAAFRQAFGFAIYSSLIEKINQKIE